MIAYVFFHFSIKKYSSDILLKYPTVLLKLFRNELSLNRIIRKV
jgi:hypothetical protein